jgi:hypothetical protein
VHHRGPPSYPSVTVVSQWCYSGVIVVLSWCYGGTVVLPGELPGTVAPPQGGPPPPHTPTPPGGDGDSVTTV